MKAVLWVVEARHSRQYAWIAVAAAAVRADARKAQEVKRGSYVFTRIVRYVREGA